MPLNRRLRTRARHATNVRAPCSVGLLLGPLLQRPNHMTVWRMASSGMLRSACLVGTDVSEDRSASLIRVTRIGEEIACVGCSLQLALFLSRRFLSPWWRRRYVPPKRRFLQGPHGVTSQKTPFFIVTAQKTSNLRRHYPAGLCSGDVMCLLWSTKWVFISQKTTFFIVTAVNTSNLT
jgi:hypothetical protein